MGTVVTYNGVTLHNVVTREWSQDIHYDESGTDVLFHTFRLRFQGILHSSIDLTAWTGVAEQDSMVDQYTDVQARLGRARGTLVVTVADAQGNATQIFKCTPAPGQVGTTTRDDIDRDVNNGPKPMQFKVLQVIGANCLRVEWEIHCSKICSVKSGGIGYDGSGTPGGNKRIPHVLSNRWSVSEAMDDNHFITRTISGKLRLSAIVHALKADYKWLVIPGMEPGFRRTAIDFSVDKTGLECEYRITDKQVHTAAPWPATKMNCRHTQSTRDGLKMSSEVQVQLEGPPNADKRLMILRCMHIIDAKLNFAKMKSEVYKRYFPENVSITDTIGERNMVNATVRFLETMGKLDKKLDPKLHMANLRDNLGNPLELRDIPGQPYKYDPTVSGPPAVYGYDSQGKERRASVLLLMQCYLQQPCYDVHGITKGAKSPTAKEEDGEGGKGYKPTIGEGPPGYLPTSSEDDVSDSAKDYLYTFARMSTRYTTDQLRVQLPIARSLTDTTTKDTSKIVRLGPGQCRRVIEIDMERAGILPEIVPPDDTYKDGEIEGTLLEHWIEPHPPSLTCDGVTRLYRITARYVYALNRPPKQDEKFRIGVAPQTRYKMTDKEAQFDPAQAYNNKYLGP